MGENNNIKKDTKEELLQSVEEIFKSNKEYNIPNYQRGYKWTEEDARILLDDLKKFHDNNPETKDNNEKFYCLQNITICGQSGNKYNVVDGQQRLTTLMILLSYLKETELVNGKIVYEIREETDKFIKENVIKRKIWSDSSFKKEVKENEQSKLKHKDEYYIYKVAEAIDKWFNKNGCKDENEQNGFKETILNRTKLIVNQLDGKNEEEIFANLNCGKVDLDGADLLRAILMTRSAKEKYGDNASIDNRVNEYRIRMGMELDEMNLWWGKKEITNYFSQFLPEGVINSAKNKFNQKVFPINILYMLYYETKDHNDGINAFNIRFFENPQDSNGNSNDNNWEMYSDIRRLHHEMQDWFQDNKIYHYLGYLFFMYKGKKLNSDGEVSFSYIYKTIWKGSKSKNEFKNKLKEQIIYLTFSQYYTENNTETKEQSQNGFLNSLEKDIKDITHNWYNDDRLVSILILVDIISFINSNSINRLPVDYFKVNNEDKEHIRSQTPNKEDLSKKEKWINSIKTLHEYDKKINIEDLINKLKDDSVNEKQQNEIIRIFNSFGLNSIGNLVLLNLGVNRGYGNDAYIKKRNKIINNYYSGVYIRPHTLEAFIKRSSIDVEKENIPEGWTNIDIKNNAENIYKSIEEWIKKAE